MEFVVLDKHHGFRQAPREALSEPAWQRCNMHFLRNAIDQLPHEEGDDCLQEVRWFYDRRNLAEARRESVIQASRAMSIRMLVVGRTARWIIQGVLQGLLVFLFKLRER